MVGTQDLAALDVWARHTDTKLLLVGDDRQLPEIEAGGAFRVIAERNGAVELMQVHRQRNRWDREALDALRHGRTADWAEAYIQHARVKTADNAPAVREQLASDWWQAKETGADARMIAMRRADVADLNARARDKLRDAGRLGPDIDYGGQAFASGDEIVVSKNDRRLGVINGDRGRVLDAADSHLDVKLDRGDELRLLRTFHAERHVDYGYATTAHKAQGATMDQAFVLGSQKAYREWGYAALSRHRDESTYYLTEPKDFINRDDAHQLDDPEQLALELEQNLADSRRHRAGHRAGGALRPRQQGPVTGRRPRPRHGLRDVGERTVHGESTPQLVDAAAVAAMLGVTRGWVYEHAAELGAVRLGSGARPRLRFDPDVVGVPLEDGLTSRPGRRRTHRFRRPRIASDVELLPIAGVPSKRALRAT